MKASAILRIYRFCGSVFLVCGILLGFPLAALGQEDGAAGVDPFAQSEVPLKADASLKVVYEVFSLPLSKAASLQRAGLADSAMYQRLLTGLDKDGVKLETFLTVRGIAGKLMTTAQGFDFRYPVEFGPPELPNMVVGPIQRKTPEGEELIVFPVTASSPSAYKTRFLGKSLDLKAKVDDAGWITLEMEPKDTVLLKNDVYGRGKAKVEFPRFAVPGLMTAVAVTSGKPFLLGTLSPPTEVQAKEGKPITHFAFVTVTRLDEIPTTEKK